MPTPRILFAPLEAGANRHTASISSGLLFRIARYGETGNSMQNKFLFLICVYFLLLLLIIYYFFTLKKIYYIENIGMCGDIGKLGRFRAKSPPQIGVSIKL